MVIEDAKLLTFPEICAFTKENGQRCQAKPMHGSPFCFFHSPQVASVRREAARRGGLARHGAKNEPGNFKIETPADLLPIMEATLNDTWGLEGSVGRSRTIGYLVGVLLEGFRARDHEARLAALEERARLEDESRKTS